MAETDLVRTAVVTGGASGIGAAVVNRLRAAGHRVAIIDLKPGDDELSFAADVTDRGQIDTALTQIREQLGPVGILVNAAGLDGFKKFNHISFEDWQQVIDVNLNGVFHTIQAVLPDMVAASTGDASSTSPRRAPTPEFLIWRTTLRPNPQ